MLGALGPAIELALFVMTLAWVGRRPTAAKVTVMIVIVSMLAMGGAVYGALQQGVGVSDWYLAAIDRQLQVYRQSLSADQVQVLGQTMGTVARFWPTVCVVYGTACVFVALALRWFFGRFVVRKSRWSAFSEVDLPVWTVVPLIVGIAVYAMHFVPFVPSKELVCDVALNIVGISMVPLFVQGAAATKGTMNRMGLGVGWQIVIGLAGIVFGFASMVLPIVGLVDYWANIRRLPREEPPAGQPV